MTNSSTSKSRSRPPVPCFRIGQNRLGRWVVQDPRGIAGGLFLTRRAALKFAFARGGDHVPACILVPGVIEFDFCGLSRSRAVAPAGDQPSGTAVRRETRS